MSLRVNDSDNGTIRRRVFAFERKARFLSSTPENEFTDAGTSRIDRHHRLPLRLEVLIEGLNNQELAILEGIVLDGRDNCANHAR